MWLLYGQTKIRQWNESREIHNDHWPIDIIFWLFKFFTLQGKNDNQMKKLENFMKMVQMFLQALNNIAQESLKQYKINALTFKSTW